MNDTFTFDYVSVKMKALQRSVDELTDVSHKIFNALIRIENVMRENTEYLLEEDES